MTIKIEKRDLFTVPQGYYLAHCISADFKLGAGIAKQFDEVFNMKYKLFAEYGYYTYHGGDALPIDNVFNLVTKEKYYEKPTYKSLTEALEEMRHLMKMFHITKLAMPKIGCGLDKLDWNNVLNIITDIFGESDVEILVCEL